MVDDAAVDFHERLVFVFPGRDCVSFNELSRELLSVGFRPTVVLDLDMEILATFRAKKLITTIIRAYKGAINLNCRSPHMLLPPALAGSKAIRCLRRVIQNTIIILIRCGDIVGMNEKKYAATGSTNFGKYIQTGA